MNISRILQLCAANAALFLLLSTMMPSENMASTIQVPSLRPRGQMEPVSSSTSRLYAQSDIECLAETIYREAYSESKIGQIAVAHVVLNRVHSQKFPTSICGVVYQKTGRVCQFSWVCQKRGKIKTDYINETKVIAHKVLAQKTEDPTKGALFFHNKTVRKNKRIVTKTVIGNHIFYR